MIRVKTINHVAVRADDLAATARFYADVLGLEPAPMPAMGPDDRERFAMLTAATSGPPFSGVAWMEAGGCQIHIIAAPPRTAPGASPFGAHLALEVADFEAARSDLARRGIAYLEGPEGLPVRQLWIADPSGNTIELWFRSSEEA